MATKEKTEGKAPRDRSGEELVDIMLFKGTGKYSDDVFVAVNGETCLVKRGVPVKIKRKFADVLKQSMEQDAKTTQLIELGSESVRQASAVLG